MLAKLHMRLPGRLGWDSCGERSMGGDACGKCLRGCMRGCRQGWARIGAWKLPKVDAPKKCSGCPYQEVLGKSSSNNTTAHHHVEANVVSMGKLRKSVVNTREDI